MRVALVARVTGQPMSSPDGRFAVDPAVATGARDAVGAISRRVLVDPDARVTLAVPPVLLAEWRRLSGGYTLATAPPCAPTIRCRSRTTRRSPTSKPQSTRSGSSSSRWATPIPTSPISRITGSPTTSGRSTTRASRRCFRASRSPRRSGTAPAGGCVPPNDVGVLAEKGVRYVVVDSELREAGQGPPRAAASTPSPRRSCSHSSPRRRPRRPCPRATPRPPSTWRSHASPTRRSGPSSSASTSTVTRAPTTDSVGAALSAFEMQPWVQLVSARTLRPAAGAGKVRLAAGRSTPRAPKGFWNTVAKSRSYADAYYAALGPSDPGATVSAAAVARRGELGVGRPRRLLGGSSARA